MPARTTAILKLRFLADARTFRDVTHRLLLLAPFLREEGCRSAAVLMGCEAFVVPPKRESAAAAVESTRTARLLPLILPVTVLLVQPPHIADRWALACDDAVGGRAPTAVAVIGLEVTSLPLVRAESSAMAGCNERACGGRGCGDGEGDSERRDDSDGECGTCNEGDGGRCAACDVCCRCCSACACICASASACAWATKERHACASASACACACASARACRRMLK